MSGRDKSVKTVIFGATFLGVSLTLSKSEDSIIIERSCLIGSEFVDSFNEKKRKKIHMNSIIGQHFSDTLKEKKILNENGDIYSVPAMFTLCNDIRENHIKILFSTEILAIEKINNQYRIKILNCEGISYIYAKNIIDTTSKGVLHNEIAKINAGKYLNSIIYNDTNQAIPEISETTTNGITKKTILHLKVGLETDWYTARNKLIEFLKENHDCLNGWKVSLMANTFAYIMPPTKIELDKNYYWYPSCSYYNLLEAFDKGGY